MANVIQTIRRIQTDTNEVRGVNFDLTKINVGLVSNHIDLPNHQTIEERTLWLQSMMQQRKQATFKD